jgi:6-phosphogluconolactonase
MRFGIIIAMLLTALPAALADQPSASLSNQYWVLIGAYTGKTSKGIYRCEFDLTTGKLSAAELAVEVENPSFLAIHPNHQFLYAVGETQEFHGNPGGSIHAFSFDPKTGKLKAINSQPSGGGSPCHLIVDNKGKNLLVANYGGGSAAVLPIRNDGGLGEPSCIMQHTGRSVDPDRQAGPHAHSINLDPTQRFAVVADLGLDRVFVYRYDSDKGTIVPNDPPATKLADAAGPRHFAFHPSGSFAYVINEMNCTVDAMRWSPDGRLNVIQTISTLPHALRNGYSTAEVQVHPSGRFLYGSNRGQDTITAFRIDTESGKLALIGHQGEGIKVPRNFGIDPTGRYMIVANQEGHSLVVFAIDPESGALRPTGNKIEVGSPVCVKFVAKE